MATGAKKSNPVSIEDAPVDDCKDILEAARRLTALKKRLGEVERQLSKKSFRQEQQLRPQLEKIRQKIKHYEWLLVSLTESTAAGGGKVEASEEAGGHHFKDYRALISDLESQGWRIVQLDATHYRAMPPDKTQQMVHFSTSNEPRAIKNTLARLKRSGYVERAAVGEAAAECSCKKVAEAKPNQAQDFYTDVDAITQGAKKYNATHFSGGEHPMLFTPLAGGYIARKAFKREGYYHWPIAGKKVDALPSSAQPIENLVSWLPRKSKEAAESVTVTDGIPWVSSERDAKAFETVLKQAKSIGPIGSSKAVYDLLKPWAAKQMKENFVVVLLDIRGDCLGVAKVHEGGRDRVAVHVPDVMKPAIERGATAIVICHNHPSGTATPSDADKQLTESIREACESNEIEFLDHVVIGTGEFYSFADGGLTKV